MKKILLVVLVCSIFVFTSCGKEECSNSGKLKIEYGGGDYYYGNPNWVPGALFLYSAENPDNPLETITTSKKKSVQLRLLIGSYILYSEHEGEDPVRFQILPGRNTTVLYRNDSLIMK